MKSALVSPSSESTGLASSCSGLRGFAGPPKLKLSSDWDLNRLRHSAATEIRRQFGREAVQVTLGHATADVSRVYAERGLSLAVRIMREIGQELT